MASSALGPGFVPIRPLLPAPAPPPSHSSRQTLDSAQLRALYVPLPNQIRSRGRPSVSFLIAFFPPNFSNN
jgi:hypothetical protein